MEQGNKASLYNEMASAASTVNAHIQKISNSSVAVKARGMASMLQSKITSKLRTASGQDDGEYFVPVGPEDVERTTALHRRIEEMAEELKEGSVVVDEAWLLEFTELHRLYMESCSSQGVSGDLTGTTDFLQYVLIQPQVQAVLKKMSTSSPSESAERTFSNVRTSRRLSGSIDVADIEALGLASTEADTSEAADAASPETAREETSIANEDVSAPDTAAADASSHEAISPELDGAEAATDTLGSAGAAAPEAASPEAASPEVASPEVVESEAASVDDSTSNAAGAEITLDRSSEAGSSEVTSASAEVTSTTAGDDASSAAAAAADTGITENSGTGAPDPATGASPASPASGSKQPTRAPALGAFTPKPRTGSSAADSEGDKELQAKLEARRNRMAGSSDHSPRTLRKLRGEDDSGPTGAPTDGAARTMQEKMAARRARMEEKRGSGHGKDDPLSDL